MFYKKINILILLSFLTGCTVNYNYPEVPQPQQKTNYGIWNYSNCQLKAKRGNVLVTLTDVFADDGARMTIQPLEKLQSMPKINILGLEGYDLEVTGKDNFYSIEIPAGISEQARMYLNETFLQVMYTAANKDYPTRSIFALEGLPEAMLYIQKNCI